MSEDLTVLDTLYWWGVPSLFRCPVDPDPANTRSRSPASPTRPATARPSATSISVRARCATSRRTTGAIHKAYGFSPWEACTIHDVGDVPLPEGMDNELCVERISAFFKGIADAGAWPVSIGGDHGITGAIVQGIAGRLRLTDGRPVALLHLDAHTDSYDLPLDGAIKSAANWPTTSSARATSTRPARCRSACAAIPGR